MSAPGPKRRLLDGVDIYDALSAVAFTIVSAVALSTFRDYGLTWDEPGHVVYGDRILEFYSSGFDYKHYLSSAYGGAYDLLGALFRKVVPIDDPYEAMHLLGCLVGLSGLVGVWKLTRHLFGAQAALWALLLLSLTPVYYGHMFNNPKDTPFAVGYIWSLYYLARIFSNLPSIRWTDLLKLGVLIGLSTATRIAGLLLFAYLGAGLAAYLIFRAARAWNAESCYQLLKRFTLTGAATTIVAWLFMVACWPWTTHSPILRPLQALDRFSYYVTHQRKMPFGDGLIETTEVPWDYLPRYFFLKLPEIVLVFAVAGLLGGAWLLIRRARRLDCINRNITLGLLGTSIVLPPAYAIIGDSPLYDGLRHFLFIVPPLTVVAAGALFATLEWAARSKVRWVGLLFVVVVLCSRQVYAMVRLHPQQYVHFNALAGGLAGADGRYDTDYYGASYRETLLKLQQHLWLNEREHYLNHVYVIKSASCAAPDTILVLPPSFVHASRELPGELKLGYTRTRCARGNTPMLVSAERDGVILSLVRDLRSVVEQEEPK